MLKKVKQLTLLMMLALGFMGVFAVPAQAATIQLSGRAFLDPGGQCPRAPMRYRDFVSYPPIVMTGSLEGCWYTKVLTTKETPSGVYLETGEEVFVGRLDGGTAGLFTTTYKFESKWDPDVSTGSEVRGRCQHPIVAGSGTGGFQGATGRVDFKDVVETGDYLYRGHVSLR
jgi:hypothetical protein